MFHVEFDLPRQSWRVMVFFSAKKSDAPKILRYIGYLGIGRRTMQRCYENLYVRWKPNTGLTVTNFRSRCSLTVISRQTSFREFINTYAHELNHLEMHIGGSCAYNPYGEKASYLSGELSSKILGQLFAR